MTDKPGDPTKPKPPDEIGNQTQQTHQDRKPQPQSQPQSQTDNRGKGNRGEDERDGDGVAYVAHAKVAPPGLRVPSHGQGFLLPPIQPGEARNPSGRPKTLQDVRKLARKQSMDALTALIGVYKRPDGKLDRTTDGKTVVAAASAVLKWAYGEPPPYDPNLEKPETRIDLEGMSLQDRKRLLDAMNRVSTVIADSGNVDDGPDFDVTRFASEPMTIDAEPMPSMLAEMPRTTQRPKKPKRKAKKPPAVVAPPVVPEKRKRGRPRKVVLVPKRGRGRPKKNGYPE